MDFYNQSTTCSSIIQLNFEFYNTQLFIYIVYVHIYTYTCIHLFLHINKHIYQSSPARRRVKTSHDRASCKPSTIPPSRRGTDGGGGGGKTIVQPADCRSSPSAGGSAPVVLPAWDQLPSLPHAVAGFAVQYLNCVAAGE
jgi:hypothetical protein